MTFTEKDILLISNKLIIGFNVLNKKDRAKVEKQRQKEARDRKLNDKPVSFLLRFPSSLEKDSMSNFAKSLGMPLNVFTLEALRYYKSHRSDDQ